MTQLAPPTPVIKNLDPKLSVEPTVIVQDYAQAPKINIKMFGDPFGKVGPPSAGPGTGGGIGTGRGTGVGSGRGAGVGTGIGRRHRGRCVSNRRRRLGPSFDVQG